MAWFKPDMDWIGGRRAILVDGYLPSMDKIHELAEELYKVDILKHEFPRDDDRKDLMFLDIANGIRQDYHNRVGDTPKILGYRCAIFLTQFMQGFAQRREDLLELFNRDVSGNSPREEVLEFERMIEVEIQNERRLDDNRQLIVTYNESRCRHEDGCMRELSKRTGFEVKDISSYVSYNGFRKYALLFLEKLVIDPFENPESIIERQLRKIGIETYGYTYVQC